jgi:lysophospholipase L1-like esterase
VEPGLLVALAGIVSLVLLALSESSDSNPLYWQDAIEAFEVEASRSVPPQNAVVFVGSSSIRMWRSLAEDMCPIRVIQRGFGGARLSDLVAYAERLVNVYRPLAVVVFAGSNDITPEASSRPIRVLQHYQAFVARVRADLPTVPIYYIAITPSPERWSIWSLAASANRLIQAYAQTQDHLYFIDTGPALLDHRGVPDPANYLSDDLHLSQRGYAIWRRIIRSRLLQNAALAAPADSAGRAHPEQPCGAAAAPL